AHVYDLRAHRGLSSRGVVAADTQTASWKRFWKRWPSEVRVRPAARLFLPRRPEWIAHARRLHGKEGSTVRVRQRALQKPEHRAFFSFCLAGRRSRTPKMEHPQESNSG